MAPTAFISPFELAGAVKRARRDSTKFSGRMVKATVRRGQGRTGVFQVLNEELFEDALEREQKRAERFEQPFCVMLCTIAEGHERLRDLRRVIEALGQITPGTDVIGWYRQDTVLGVIRPLGDSTTSAQTLEGKFRQELGHHLSTEEVKRCSILCEVYSPLASSTVLKRATRRKPQQMARDAAKRFLDVAGSAALLIMFAPVFLIVSALVKLTSKGPVLFPQERVGEGGRPFTMMKFRTMHVNADPRIHQQYVEHFIQSGGTASSNERVFKIVNDPRVTPIGHFLRRSSLDELPQFWNVLRGDMSLVGPRPPLPYEVARYKSWHRRRVVEAKPGLTGLWQVTGRSRTTFDEMVRLDLRYAKNYSVWTDLKILLATPRAMISGKGAH